MGVIAHRARVHEAVPAERIEMPFQRLAVLTERDHHLVLDCDVRDHVVRAVKVDGRTADALGHLPGRDRTHVRRGLVPHRGVVTHERPHRGRCRHEVDGDPPAHAIAAHRHPAVVHVGLGEQKPPAFRERLGELVVGCPGLDLGTGLDVRGRGVSELLEHVGGKSAVTQGGELARLDLDVVREPGFRVNEQQRRPGLRPLRMDQETGDAVVLAVESALDELHESSSLVMMPGPERNTMPSHRKEAVQREMRPNEAKRRW